MVSYQKREKVDDILQTQSIHDLALFTNIPAQAESLLHSLDQATRGIGLYLNTNKIESNVNTCIGKGWTTIDRLLIIWLVGLVFLLNGISSCGLFNNKSILIEEQKQYYLTHSWGDKRVHAFPISINSKVNVIAWLKFEFAYHNVVVQLVCNYAIGTHPLTTWKSDLTDKIKLDFFQAMAMLVLLYACTTWKDENFKRMLHAVLNKSWKLHSTKQQLCSHLLPTVQTIQVRWTKHAGYSWRSKDKLISILSLQIPEHGHTSVGWPAKICQLCANTGCSLEGLSREMNDRDRWWQRKSKNTMLSIQLNMYTFRIMIEV